MKFILSFILANILLNLGAKVNAQEKDTYDILKNLVTKINKSISIADSSYPLEKYMLINSFQEFDLTRKEKRELLKNLKKTKGIRISQVQMADLKLVSADTIFKLLEHVDTTNWEYFESIKPFYLFSAPVFFDHNNKAFVSLDLIGGMGYTILYYKINNEWVVYTEKIRWVN